MRKRIIIIIVSIVAILVIGKLGIHVEYILHKYDYTDVQEYTDQRLQEYLSENGYNQYKIIEIRRTNNIEEKPFYMRYGLVKIIYTIDTANNDDPMTYGFVVGAGLGDMYIYEEGPEVNSLEFTKIYFHDSWGAPQA